MSQQGRKQASIRAVTGRAETYEGDWAALFDQASIPAGPFNGRLLAWINIKLTKAYANLTEAQAALAAANGAFNFASMGSFDATTSGASAPANTIPVAITGTGSVGSTLTAAPGTYTGSPSPTKTYQWKADGVDISGATSTTYVLTSGELGKQVSVVETATNASGSANSTSNSIGPVAGAPAAPVNTVAPAITGADYEGSVLSCSTGTWTGSPTPSFTYQWKKGGSDISGATANVYTRATADIGGGTITCNVTATNASGSASQISNTAAATLNSIFARIGIRNAAADVTDLSRWTYLVAADGTSAVSNRVPQGGVGAYSFQAIGTVTPQSNGLSPSYLTGYVALTSSTQFVKVSGVPTGLTAKVRLCLGRAVIPETNVGFSIWDGDPTTTGVKRAEGVIAAIADGDVGSAAATGNTPPTMSPNNWASLAVYVDVLCNTGTIYIGRNFTGPYNGYLKTVEIVHPNFVVSTSGAGPYFAKEAGDDTKDGLSIGNAWAHAPGDAGAGGAVAAFVVTQDGVMNFNKGDRIRAASFTSRTKHMSLLTSGASGHVITYQATGTGAAPVIDGSEILSTWTAATSGNMGANPNYTSCEKATLGAQVNWNQFLVEGNNRLYPAQWPVPGSRKGYDNLESGSDAFNDESTTTGPYGASAQFTVGAADSSRSGWKVCTYTGSKVLNRYGSVSINGYRIICRIAGNDSNEYDITSHNTGTGSFTFEIPNGQDLYTSTSTAHFLWAIRYHPFDVRMAGQYAFIDPTTRVNPVAWFTSGTRGISRFNDGLILDKSYFTFSGLHFSRIGSGNTGHAITDNGSNVSNVTLSNITITQCTDYQREGVIRAVGGGSNWAISDLDISDCHTQGCIQAGSLNSSTITRFKARSYGRTGIYFGLNSHDNACSDIDLCDNSAIHGQPVSFYQDSLRCSLQNALLMNNSRAITVQGDTNGLDRSHVFKNFVATGRATPSFAPNEVSLYVVSFDANSKNTVVEGGIIAGGTGLKIGGGCDGMVVRNTIINRLNPSYGNESVLNVVTFENVLVLTDNASITSANYATYIGASSFGVTFLNGSEWDGTISQTMQQKLTKQGSAATYAARNIGLTTGKTWNVPAWGTAFALADCWLTTTTVDAGFQGGVNFGCVGGTQPGSSLSLPAGVVNNNLFTLASGMVCFTASPSAGSYTIRIRQTNNHPDLTGGGTQTKDTDIVITVA